MGPFLAGHKAAGRKYPGARGRPHW